MSDSTVGVNWNLTNFFPEFGGALMEEFKAKLYEDVERLQRLAGEAGALDGSSAGKWEEVILLSEDFGTRAGHILAYVGCLDSADATNDAYSQERAALGRLIAEYNKFDVDLAHAFKEAAQEDFDAFVARPKLEGLEFGLRRTRERAQYTMTQDQEKLCADLSIDGLNAWGRLYDRITGKLEFTVKYPDGTEETKPISQWRASMSDPDRARGRAAFDGGNEAWAKIADVCAAALNAIAGTRLTMNRYRGRKHFLDGPLFSAATTEETLDAMYAAIEANIDTAREIFRTKAKAIGQAGICFFERESPLPVETDEKISWESGVKMVDDAFAGVYPALTEYYRSVHDQRWIESELRPGKRPGAFCTGSPLLGEQRVYMTFNGTLSDVKTMAHEVGHAFHSHLLKEMRPGARGYPMTLAETASIFAEHILAEGIYSSGEVSDEQKLAMLDTDLCGAAILILDITVRFRFEKKFHEERAKGELSVSRFKELMVETQREVFGDALLPDGADPYFWASKLHFYITGVSFYNFPYTFGFLLARSLYTLMKKEGPSFLPKYEEFLRLTGSDTVEGVAKRAIGVDVTKPDFWAASLKSLEEPLKLYKKLLAAKA